MRYFITGATGYIGSHLVKQLTDRGHTVHALVRNPEKAEQIRFNENVHLFQGDITDAASIEKAMAGCEHVFHLAAFAKVWAKDPKTFFDLNVVATNNVLDAAIKHGIKRTVVTSTAGVFGASLYGTIDETSSRDLDFFNEYESSKALSESKIKDYVIAGLDVVIVSPTRVYGPFLFGKTESITMLVEKFIKGKWRMIPGDGSKVGNYVYVHDVVSGHLLAMEKGTKGHTYILGGENHDYNAFFDTLKKVSGIRRSMIRMPLGFQMAFSRLQMMKTWIGREPLITPKWIAKGRYDWRVSPQKAKDELGLQITSLEEGLRNTVEWVRRR